MNKYIFIGTEKDLHNNYFDENGVRGEGTGWSHKVDPITKEIRFVDEEYAALRNNYEQIGGLKSLIKDLIDKKLVKIIKGC